MLRNGPSQGPQRRDLNEEYHHAKARAVILEVLADPDGGGMCWNPSGEPSPRACSVADRIIRELVEGGF